MPSGEKGGQVRDHRSSLAVSGLRKKVWPACLKKKRGEIPLFLEDARPPLTSSIPRKGDHLNISSRRKRTHSLRWKEVDGVARRSPPVTSRKSTLLHKGKEYDVFFVQSAIREEEEEDDSNFCGEFLDLLRRTLVALPEGGGGHEQEPGKKRKKDTRRRLQVREASPTLLAWRAPALRRPSFGENTSLR